MYLQEKLKWIQKLNNKEVSAPNKKPRDNYRGAFYLVQINA